MLGNWSPPPLSFLPRSTYRAQHYAVGRCALSEGAGINLSGLVGFLTSRGARINLSGGRVAARAAVATDVVLAVVQALVGFLTGRLVRFIFSRVVRGSLGYPPCALAGAVYTIM